MEEKSEPPPETSSAESSGSVFLDDGTMARLTKQAPVGPAAGSEPQQTWQQRFLAILNNTAKSGDPASASGPVRTRGFLVITHGTESLQPVQSLCHQPDQRFTTCLTARYTVRPPVLGNLLAAFVTDMARLAQTPGGAAPVGDLQPTTTGLGTPPWGMLRSAPFADLAAAAQLDKESGELPADWVAQFFQALTEVLHTGIRLVLFVEVEDGTRPEDWQRIVAVAPSLPERLGLVLSGAPPTVPIPPELAWDATASGPTGSCIELEVERAPRTPAVQYLDAPLSGDTPAGTDAFDRGRYAFGLAKLVLLPGTGPLTIGVHAPWGRGKTSFMHFIERELICNATANRTPRDERQHFDQALRDQADPAKSDEEREKAQDSAAKELEKLRRRARRDVIPVWFNAWRYEGATQIWAGLTHEITERIEQTLPWYRRIWARVLYAVRNQGAAFWLGSLIPAVAALLATALVLSLGLNADRTGIADQLPDWLRWLLPAAPSVSLLALGAYLTWRFTRVVRPVSERLLDYVRQPDYRQHMGYQHQVLRDIEFLMNRLGAEKQRPRVVVFIDDLDRCSDEKVLETLQAINLLLTASGCYVFLGIDTHMIAQAVARKYELAEHEEARAESYLRKIIQLSIRLPAAEQDQRVRLLAQLFSPAVRLAYEAQAGSAPAQQAPSTSPREDPRRSVRRPVTEGLYGWSASGVSRPAVFEIADVEDTVDELDAFARLRDVIPDNPRELKRLANLHRLVKILIQRKDAPPTAVAQRLLVAWLVFCFVYGGAAAELLRRARAEEPAKVVERSELKGLLDRLNRDHPADQVPPLTAAQLKPGTPLVEAAAISAHFQERPDDTPEAGSTVKPGGTTGHAVAAGRSGP